MVTTAPEMQPAFDDVDQLLDEVKAYHALYNPLLQRREQCEKSQEYLYGLLAPEMRKKAIEPIVLTLRSEDPSAIRAMQHFIGERARQDMKILQQHWHEVSFEPGEVDGVFTPGGSDFPKRGQESVGVQGQYCGELGKVANCQAGAFVGYASRKGYTLLHRALYLPESWVNDPTYVEQREKCGVPDTLEFQTKPQLGRAMLEAILNAGSLPGRWVACHEAFGRSTVFLDQVVELGLWYYAVVPLDTPARRERPRTHIPPWSGQGPKPTRKRLVEGKPKFRQVRQLAKALTTEDWSRHTNKEGSQGPMVADFALLHVTTARHRLPGPEL